MQSAQGNESFQVAFARPEFDHRQPMSGNQTTTKTRGVPKSRRYAVVMAGGVGTRFWPWSRANVPKQLLALAGEKSMLAETVSRLDSFVPSDNTFVVTSERLRRAVRRELRDLPGANVLCEPVGRNTAPCIGWAAIEIYRRDPQGVMIVLPADHVVRPVSAFARAVRQALSVADRTRGLVTFGIRPNHPATGYGYIRAGAPLDGEREVLRVGRFHEKPSIAVARRFVASGDYYWNSGMFAWRADVVLAAIERHLPDLHQGLCTLEAGRRGAKIPASLLARVFPRLPSVSIDHGVMEKTSGVLLIRAPFEWNDIGSWDAVGDLWPVDGAGNRSRDPVIAVDSHGNVVATRGKPVALLGVNDLAIVDAGDALLVCPRDRAEQVRSIVESLRREGWRKLL